MWWSATPKSLRDSKSLETPNVVWNVCKVDVFWFGSFFSSGRLHLQIVRCSLIVWLWTSTSIIEHDDFETNFRYHQFELCVFEDAGKRIKYSLSELRWLDDSGWKDCGILLSMAYQYRLYGLYRGREWEAISYSWLVCYFQLKIFLSTKNIEHDQVIPVVMSTQQKLLAFLMQQISAGFSWKPEVVRLNGSLPTSQEVRSAPV